jgi:hypothetical protein
MVEKVLPLLAGKAFLALRVLPIVVLVVALQLMDATMIGGTQAILLHFGDMALQGRASTSATTRSAAPT